MKAETISAIAAVAAAVIAIGAAVMSKKSADKSIAAERDSAAAATRSAAAAEEALAIERKRLGYEESDRAAVDAPRLSPGNATTQPWTLAQNGTALVGDLCNHGPTDAMIESITAAGPDGPLPANPISDDGYIAERSVQQIVIPWPPEHDPGSPVITVTYEAATGTGYRASLEFRLRRFGADPNGQPLFKPGETNVHRL